MGHLYENFKVEAATPTIGGYVQDLDLTKSHEPALYKELRKALSDHKVLFFRNQNMSDERFLELGNSFGKLEVHEFFPCPENKPEIQIITTNGGRTGTDRWHTDVTFRPNPSAASILRAKDIPADGGGDTMWLCTNAAYNALSDSLKTMLHKLTAIHDMRLGMTGYLDPDVVEKNARENPPLEHPVVIAHPVTGKPHLFVNSIWTSGFKDLPLEESKMLLNFLNDHIKRPEFQVRLRWDVDTIAIWDNIATQHYALGDYEYKRVMNRMIVDGVAPKAFMAA